VKRIMAIAAAAVTIAGLGTAGMAAASTRPQSAGSGAESFELVATTAGQQGITFKAIYYGVVTAVGTEVSPGSGNTDTVHLPGGTFQLRHSNPPNLRLINARTCLASGAGRARWTLTAGTGKYKGISGGGSAQISELAVLGKSHGVCTENAPPAGLFIIVNGHGKAHL
jgi:hypothetical protein